MIAASLPPPLVVVASSHLHPCVFQNVTTGYYLPLRLCAIALTRDELVLFPPLDDAALTRGRTPSPLWRQPAMGRIIHAWPWRRPGMAQVCRRECPGILHQQCV